ncbi:MAG TPA: diguanylate cyclase [Rhodocyclaceae bacterium]
MILSGNSLPHRVARRIVGITLLSLLLASAVLAASAYLDERERLETLIGQIEKAFARPIAESVWLVDTPQLEAQLQALTRIDGVSHVAVTTFTGQRYHYDGPTGADHDRLSAYSVPLGRDGTLVGTLEIAASRGVIWRAIVDHLTQLLSIQAVLLALGAVALYRGMKAEATEPLAELADALTRYRPEEAPLELAARTAGRSQELHDLAGAVDGMQRTIASHLAEQRTLREELAASRDRLAELAATRESALNYLDGLEYRVLMMSTRLISLPRDQILPEVRRSLADIAQYAQLDFVGLLRAGDGDTLEVDGYGGSSRFGQFGERPAAVRAALARWVRQRLAARTAILAEQGRNANLSADESAALSRADIGALVAVPLLARDESLGLLVFAVCVDRRRDLQKEAKSFELLAQIVASALAQEQTLADLASAQGRLELANEELARMSRTDSLTGLPNRRAFDEIKHNEFNRARRSGSPLCLIMLDVDHFKAYNDHLGHAAGDQCLMALADLLQACTRRAGDVPARIGGEEFALLLADTEEDAARRLFEELARALAARALPHPASPVGPWITVSGGLARFNPDVHSDFEALYRAADAALYDAKRQGRNRLMLAAGNSTHVDSP